MHCIKCWPNLRDDESKTMQQTSSVRRGFTYSFVQRSDAIVNSSKALCLQKHTPPLHTPTSHLSSALETYFTATSKIMNTETICFHSLRRLFVSWTSFLLCLLKKKPKKNANCQIEFDTKAVRTDFVFLNFAIPIDAYHKNAPY